MNHIINTDFTFDWYLRWRFLDDLKGIKCVIGCNLSVILSYSYLHLPVITLESHLDIKDYTVNLG